VGNQATKRHRFIYGRPVRSGEFLDREIELSTIFSRLCNEESTAIVGEPHIGKSSLLLKLADQATRQDRLGGDAHSFPISWQDLHSIPGDYSPAVFWEEMLEPLKEHPSHPSVAQRLEAAAQAGYTRASLRRLFNHLGQRGQHLVLLLDEFERLLEHANFQDFGFFATIRSLASISGGLLFVTTSRLPIAELNRRGKELPGSGGSPLFNIQCEVRLRPFDERAVSLLLNRAGNALSADDRCLIRRVAGRHPFLLQAMTATLIETAGDDRQACAAERFYDQISYHFDDLWGTLDDRTRTVAVILSLVEMGKRALGQRFACGDIEKTAALGPELRRLAEQGLAERAEKGWKLDLKNKLLWRGERWTIGTQAFVWWVRDVIIAETRKVPECKEWLTDNRYLPCLPITHEQWHWLIDTVRNAPEWVGQGVGELAKGLLRGLARRR
jgi:hypothetical protein